MSSDSYETSSVASTSGNTSLEDYNLDENVVNPGPVEKKIEEYLKNFELNRIKNEISAENEKQIEKEDEEDKGKENEKLDEEKIVNETIVNENTTENKEKGKGTSLIEETIIFEGTTNSILNPKEVEYYQTFQTTCKQNQHVWQSPYNYGNQWFSGPLNVVGLENRVGNKFLNCPHSEILLNPQSLQSCSIQGEPGSFHQNADLEKISLTTQIIDMQKEDKLCHLSEILESVKKENQELKMKLKQQEEDLCVFGPRYKYLEENFEEFIKMKEEYDLLQRQKRKSEFKCTETYDKYAQTWETAVMCEFCIRTHEMLQNISEDNALCISRSEISDLEEKFNALKEIITEREFAYENREEKAELIHLTALNVGYRTQILELEAKHKQAMLRATSLQNIIAKIYSPKKAGVLTFQELECVQGIIDKLKSMPKSPKMEQNKKQIKSVHRRKS